VEEVLLARPFADDRRQVVQLADRHLKVFQRAQHAVVSGRRLRLGKLALDDLGGPPSARRRSGGCPHSL